MLEDLHIGTDVMGSDGSHLGTLTRIVIERDNDEVTHLVVDPGLVESGNLLAPGGWEKPRERVVSLSLLVNADDKHVTLSCDEEAFRQQPLFEQQYYADYDQLDALPPRFRLGELINYIASAAGLGAAPYEGPRIRQYNEPQGAAEIAEGTPVWRRKPHEEIGEVEQVLFDPLTERVTALVVRRSGIVVHPRVLLPISAVADVQDEVVHVTLTDAELDALAPYEPEE
ncbi:MAG TPA: PRC-barrel domain-containing protein [Ktedonobacterales bacterium]